MCNCNGGCVKCRVTGLVRVYRIVRDERGRIYAESDGVKLWFLGVSAMSHWLQVELGIGQDSAWMIWTEVDTMGVSQFEVQTQMSEVA